MSDNIVYRIKSVQATGGVNQLPARVLDYNSFFKADQGGGQTGRIIRTKAGTIITAKVTISQFFSPGFCI